MQKQNNSREARRKRIKALLRARKEWYKKNRTKTVNVPPKEVLESAEYTEMMEGIRKGEYGEELKQKKLHEDKFYHSIFVIENELEKLGHKLKRKFGDDLKEFIEAHEK